jgi:hypothetical protein
MALLMPAVRAVKYYYSIEGGFKNSKADNGPRKKLQVRLRHRIDLDDVRIIFYHKTRQGSVLGTQPEETMTRHNADKDSTRIRPPSPSVQKIPERYSASIVILSGFAEGMEYPITGEYTVLGRDKTAADIAVKDPLVSRRHAAIVYNEGEFALKDLGSTNGTMMGGKIIEIAELRHKDKFRIGDTIIQFILQDTGEGRIYEIAE